MDATKPHCDAANESDVQKALTENGITFNKEEFTLAKARPADIDGHTLGKSWVLLGFKVGEFCDSHGTTVFDFEKLVEQFTLAIPDYGKTLVQDVPYFCVQFCSLMIFTIGPSSRSVKKGDRDSYWSMIIPHKDGKFATVNIATYKAAPPKVMQPQFKAGQITLTVKQGSLLALRTLGYITKMSTSNPHLLTPLAGSIFCRDDIPEMAKELKIPEHEVTTMLNKSAQSGGFYLRGSSCAAAAICAVVATKNADPKIATSIVNKTVKQYIHHGKRFDDRVFDILAQFATGGVPGHLTKEKMLERINEKITLRERVLLEKAEEGSGMRTRPSNVDSNINIPNPKN